MPIEDRHDLVAETGLDPEKWIERGLLLIDDGNYNEAIEYFQKALTSNRSHPKVNEYIKKARQLRDSK